MTIEQTVVFAVLLLCLVLFVLGRWRYDIVALLALLVVTIAGIVPAEQAFAGFGHPAVITVAAVLVASRGLFNSGLVSSIASWLGRLGERPTLLLLALTALVTICSAFMNNVGALALLMPVAIQIARKSGRPPSVFLMPLAFGSLLGGMTTLIGTPPNIIIATFRAQVAEEPFGMFDFSPVGAGVAVPGVLFLALLGWRLIPRRKGQASREELFHIKDYITEVRIPENSKMVSKTLYDLERAVEEEVTVLGLVRGEKRLLAPSIFEYLQSGDILIVEADSQAIKSLIDATGLELVGSKAMGSEAVGSDEVSVMEAVVKTDSPMIGNTSWTLSLRWRYGVNLLGVARHGEQLEERLRKVQFIAGDILLLQGATQALQEMLQTLGCLPLAERGLRLGHPRRIVFAVGLFATAVTAAVTGFLPVQVSFVALGVAMVLTKLISLRDVYEAIDWPIIVLLGGMIPVGQALESTGGAQLIADGLLRISGQMPATATLVIVLVGTMFLSDLVNNAAAAVLMAPIAISVAQGMGASADPFLMAVAVGASCAFLTPIGHQSNTLVMGPGGYRFGDYWRMGLPLEVVIATISIPLILHFWPLGLVTP
jgi:di/tricarboxylate transporter